MKFLTVIDFIKFYNYYLNINILLAPIDSGSIDIEPLALNGCVMLGKHEKKIRVLYNKILQYRHKLDSHIKSHVTLINHKFNVL